MDGSPVTWPSFSSAIHTLTDLDQWVLRLCLDWRGSGKWTVHHLNESIDCVAEARCPPAIVMDFLRNLVIGGISRKRASPVPGLLAPCWMCVCSGFILCLLIHPGWELLVKTGSFYRITERFYTDIICPSDVIICCWFWICSLCSCLFSSMLSELLLLLLLLYFHRFEVPWCVSLSISCLSCMSKHQCNPLIFWPDTSKSLPSVKV